MSLPFPSPTTPRSSRADTLLAYLDYFRSVVLDKLHGLDDADLRTSRLPSGWTPLELLQHLVFVERRWLVWGFLGGAMADPWGDRRDDRWHVAAGVGLPDLVAALSGQAAVTRESWRRTTWTRSVSRASGGRAPRRPVWSGYCCTCCRSTPGTPATWTSCASWSMAAPVSRQTGPI